MRVIALQEEGGDQDFQDVIVVFNFIRHQLVEDIESNEDDHQRMAHNEE